MNMSLLTKIILTIPLATMLAMAQTSNVTATITDPDGQTWNNGTFSIVFIPTPGVPGPYTWSVGTPLPIRFSGSMNASGVLTVSLPDNAFIAPLGSKWQFTLCGNTSAPCQNVVTAVTGANPNLSTTLSTPLIAPRFSPGPNAFGYLDLEVIGPPAPGATYWNTTNAASRIWNGSAWINGGSGGSPPGAPNNSVQLNVGGVLSGVTNTNAGLLFSPTASGPPAFQNVISVTNPQANNDPNERALFRLNVTTDSTTSNPAVFSDENGLEIVQNVLNGQALYSNSGQTRAKKTFLPFAITGNFQGSGQKILTQTNANCYSMSDCAANSMTISFSGGPITGDEGQGFNEISSLVQQNRLTSNVGVSSTTRTTCNTTTTQALTASVNVQAFTVASTTGCNVNDWVVLGQEIATGSPQESVLQITAVNPGVSLSGQVVANYLSGVTVSPATVLFSNNNDATLGQDRMMVDLTTTPVTAGNVSSISGAAFTGNGTAWSTGMVGGNATVIGCIELTVDDYSGGPFSGTGTAGTLHTWYPIVSVSSATALAILSWSVAQDAAYHGNGAPSNYVIRPCAKVLRVINNSQVIMETNTFTWNANDGLEEALNAYPDITGFQYSIGQYNAGGVRRAFFNLLNTGARKFGVGINISGNMPGGTGSDSVTNPWNIGFQCAGCTTSMAATSTNAMQLFQLGSGTSPIIWGTNGPTVEADTGYTNLAMRVVSGITGAITQGNSAVPGTLIFNATDPLTAAANPTGQLVGRLDVVNNNNNLEPRFGLVGKSANTWFMQTNTGVGRNLQFFQNQNGGAQGAGVGTVFTISSTGQVILNQGAMVGVESAAPVNNLGAGFDNIWSDSTAHRWQMTNNGGVQDNVGDDLVQSCGTTSTCSHTNLTKPQIVFGSAPLVSGTPSTVTITGFSPAFTSSSSFVCTATDTTTQPNTVKVVNASASSITITGPNASTDVINYICTGN